jgi:hypothetical protein
VTTTPTLNGQDIGQAERATRALLDRLLADTGTPFVDWVALNVLATTASPMTEGDLVARLRDGLLSAEDSVRPAVDRLRATGLATTGADGPIELTAAGRARHADIRAGIDRITAAIYGALPSDDLVTAGRVLRTVAERARALLAG